MSWSKAVFSSVAQEIGYDTDTGELLVTWSNGRVSAYADVLEEVAEECSRAASVGTFLNSRIKPAHGHRYR